MESVYTQEMLVNNLLNNDCPKDIVDGVHYFVIDLHCVALEVHAVHTEEAWVIKYIKIKDLCSA